MRLSDYVERALGELGQNEGMAHIHVGLESEVLGMSFSMEEVLEIADRRFNYYTAIPAKGRWKGKGEDSVILEIVNCCDSLISWDAFLSHVFGVASHMGWWFGQQAILVILYPPRKFVRKNFPEYYVLQTDFNQSPPVQYLMEGDASKVQRDLVFVDR